MCVIHIWLSILKFFSFSLPAWPQNEGNTAAAALTWFAHLQTQFCQFSSILLDDIDHYVHVQLILGQDPHPVAYWPCQTECDMQNAKVFWGVSTGYLEMYVYRVVLSLSCGVLGGHICGTRPPATPSRIWSIPASVWWVGQDSGLIFWSTVELVAHTLTHTRTVCVLATVRRRRQSQDVTVCVCTCVYLCVCVLAIIARIRTAYNQNILWKSQRAGETDRALDRDGLILGVWWIYWHCASVCVCVSFLGHN